MPGRWTCRCRSGRGARAGRAGGCLPERMSRALDAAFTVFELAELKGRHDVQAVVLMLVVFLATQRMYHGDRTVPKAIVIDEAWDLLSGEDSRAFIEGAARRARKYRGALVTGTQSVNDYYANPAARAAWDNADWVIFLSQKDESVELLKSEKRIHCDPGMERALKSLRTADGRYAEFVLHGPDGWRVARLVLDAWSVALFSSRGPGFAAVEALKEKGMSTAEAIARVAAQRVDGGTLKPPDARAGQGRGQRRSGMSAVPVHQALYWPGESPVSGTGTVDLERLAQGLARSDYRGAPQARCYSRAQHAVLVSRAVDTLAVLDMPRRRVLAMHALLAQLRASELKTRCREADTGSGRPRQWVAPPQGDCTLQGNCTPQGDWPGCGVWDLAGLADVLVGTNRWDGKSGDGSELAPGAAVFNNLLRRLAALKAADRNRVALHALFSELVPAGLGTGVLESVLRHTGLEPEVSPMWVRILRFVRRMAEETVRRDVPGGPCHARTGFPALAMKIEPMTAAAAARLWLERYQQLAAGAAAKQCKDSTEER